MKTKKQKLSLTLFSVLLATMLLLSACKQPSPTKVIAPETSPNTAIETAPVTQETP